jgi:hypothetical protein
VNGNGNCPSQNHSLSSSNSNSSFGAEDNSNANSDGDGDSNNETKSSDSANGTDNNVKRKNPVGRRKLILSTREKTVRRLESNERERLRMHSLNQAFQVSRIRIFVMIFISILIYFLATHNDRDMIRPNEKNMLVIIDVRFHP